MNDARRVLRGRQLGCGRQVVQPLAPAFALFRDVPPDYLFIDSGESQLAFDQVERVVTELFWPEHTGEDEVFGQVSRVLGDQDDPVTETEAVACSLENPGACEACQ